MVLKGLALGGGAAAVVVALFVALTFQPTPAKVTAPAANVVMLPNGVASPQLQPVAQGAPALVEVETSLPSLVQPALASAVDAALTFRAEAEAPASAVEYQAVTSCSGK